MIHYLIKSNSDGRIVQRGACPSEAEIPSIAGCFSEVVDASDARRPASAPEQTHADARRMSYPSIGDQLDALWKGLGPLLEHPEAKAMLEKIAAVKAANPK